MRKKRLFKVMGVLTVLMGLCLIFLSFPVSAQKYGGSIKIGIPHRIVQLDSHIATAIGSITVLKQVFEPLLSYDKNLKVVPCLASKLPERTKDGGYIVTLRKGVKFHDGTELKANDVKFSFDRVLNPETGSPFRRVFKWIDSVEVLNDYQVKFNLKIPIAPDIFNEKLTGLRIMSEAAVKRLGEEVKRHPIGTGPFKFVEWVEGSHLTLEKNENYWKKGLPYLDRLTFVTIPEDSIRAMNVRLGEIDVATEIPVDLVGMLEKAPNITVSCIPSGLYDAIWLNCSKVPFNDVRVRKAFRYALNLETITKTVFSKYATPATYLLPPWHPMYNPDVPKYSQNIEKARQLLAEAGYPNGFEFELMVGNLGHLVDSATMIQSMLEKVGMKARIRLGEVESLYPYVFDDTFQAFVTWGNTIGCFGPDADILLRWILYGGGFWNWNTKGRKRLDNLLDKAIVTEDEKERKSIYTAVENIEAKEMPCIFLNYRDFICAWNSKLKGIHPDVGTVISFAKAYFVEK